MATDAQKFATLADLTTAITGIQPPGDLATDAELAAYAQTVAAAIAGNAAADGVTDAAVAAAFTRKQDQHREHPGLRAIGMGDSIMKGSDGLTFGHAGSWFSMLAGLSYGAINMIRNAGTPGNTTSQMLARYAADVLAYRPEMIALEVITPNDSPNKGITNATIRGNIRSMVEQGLAIGARVVVCTGPPQENDATRARMIENSAWLRTYAAGLGLDVWDLNTALADPATGKYKAGYSGDGTHPTRDACDILAQDVKSKLSNDFLPGGILATVSDPDNLLGTRGLFASTTAGAALADGVVGPNAASGATTARTERDDGLGFWQYLTNTAAGPALQMVNLGAVRQPDQSWLNSWLPGDVLAFSGEYENVSSTTGFTAQVNITSPSGTMQVRALSDWAPALKGKRTFYVETAIPADYVPAPGNVGIVLGAGIGTVGYSRLRLVNITAAERARKLSTAVTAALAAKANASDVYTKTQTDTAIGTKVGVVLVPAGTTQIPNGTQPGTLVVKRKA